MSLGRGPRKALAPQGTRDHRIPGPRGSGTGQSVLGLPGASAAITHREGQAALVLFLGPPCWKRPGEPSA